MWLRTILYSDVLIIIGIAGYFLTGRQSVTALIPAFFGLALLPLGVLAMRERFRKHALHAAAALALLAILGSARGLMRLPALLSGADVPRPAAVVSQSLTAAVSIIFLALCIQSFVRARTNPNPAPPPK